MSREVFNQGYLLVQKLRDREDEATLKARSNPQTSKVGVHHPTEADQLESLLIAATAFDDFPKAIQTAKELREEKLQFLALLKIANLLAHR